MKTRMLLSLAVTLLSLNFASLPATAAALGASKVVATVGAPGYPEGIAVRGESFYVAGPAQFGLPLGSAYVRKYSIATGLLQQTYPITITNPFAGISAASCIAFGEDGKLYVIEPFVGVIRMNLDGANTQSVYAPFVPSGPTLLNDLAFDEDGNLYVTDSFAARIYRVPPGGGAPTVWLSDPRLAGDVAVPFGVNGIRIDKHGKRVYVTVTAENGTLDGVVYSIALKPNPGPADMQEFHRYKFNPPALPGPDGIAFGKSGRLYVALAGTSQISVLKSNGSEEARYSGPAANPTGMPNPMPWANPANIAFDDERGRVFVTNHASLVPFDPNLFVVFDVTVKDKGLELP